MSTIQIVDPANTVLTNLCGPATRITYAALSDLSSVPVSTLWDRAHGRQSRSEKAAKQQYLTPQEEKALVSLCLGTDTFYRLNLCVLWRWDPWLGRMGPSLKVDDF
jgi:glycerol-3-phosphate O-acyltransferase